ncbi:MAG: type II secretion system F family protein [Phycisphaeraceae bacterium]|nr:type II secretion system F family protein [Phycisphaeraceae bacterium]
MSRQSYEFIAIDRGGSRVSGSVLARDQQDAFRQVSAGGRTPVKIRVERPRRSMFRRVRIGKAEVAALTRELSVLVEARIPIAHGLMSIAEHEKNPELRRVLIDVASNIEAGSTITEALARHTEVFGSVYVETMRAAEASGNLVAVTNHLAEMLERQIEAGQQLRRAMAYPVIVVGAVTLALGVILTFVVPKFEAMFASQEAALPLATRVVQALGRFANHYWWAVLGTVAALGVFSRQAIRTRRGRLLFEELLLMLPYVRQVIVSTTAARFARVFGIGLSSGLSLLESMRVGGNASGRTLFTLECDSMAEQMGQGERLSDVIRHSRYLPPFAQRMLGAGRDTKDLSNACGIIARHYEQQTTHLTKNVSTIIEPILTVLLAVIVLIVALAVFLPMWKMVGMSR